jgi:hypothetical protein
MRAAIVDIFDNKETVSSTSSNQSILTMSPIRQVVGYTNSFNVTVGVTKAVWVDFLVQPTMEKKR